MNIHHYIKPQTALSSTHSNQMLTESLKLYSHFKQVNHKQILGISATVFSPHHVVILVTKTNTPGMKSYHFSAGRLADNYLQGTSHSP